jgi:integrase
MAKKARPWFWEARNGWYVLLHGRRHFLGEHPGDAPRPKKGKNGWNSPTEIDAAFSRLLRGAPAQSSLGGSDTAVQVLDDFVAWSHENRARSTAQRYQEFIQDFVRAAPEGGGLKFGALPVSQLTSHHVTSWLAQRPAWGPTTKRNAITALIRGFNWAVKNRGLPSNPIAGMEKPEARRRSDVITPAEFDELLSVVRDEEFRDLLIVSYDCGARPFEVKDLEKRHVQADKRRAVIPADEAKGRKYPRTIYFPTDRSMAVVTRLCESHPDGPIFRNTSGKRWTGNAVKCRFEDIEVLFGLKEMGRQGITVDLSDEAIEAFMKTLSPTKRQRGTGKDVRKETWELRKEARLKLVAQAARKHGKRFRHYAFRRTFITRKIIAGVDSHVVARLSGHQSTAMIDRHYSGVANDHEFMLLMAARDMVPKEQAQASPATGA